MEPEQVRNIMDSMIRKLYDMELEEQGRSDWTEWKHCRRRERYLKEHFLLDISEYDVIIGYRADDSYFFVCTGFCGRGNLVTEAFGSYAAWETW